MRSKRWSAYGGLNRPVAREEVTCVDRHYVTDVIKRSGRRQTHVDDYICGHVLYINRYTDVMAWIFYDVRKLAFVSLRVGDADLRVSISYPTNKADGSKTTLNGEQ